MFINDTGGVGSGWPSIHSDVADKVVVFSQGFAVNDFTFSYTGTPEAIANARLIAAAPDLLRELEGVVHFADGFACYYSDGPAGRALREWINGARAAIAKAEGR